MKSILSVISSIKDKVLKKDINNKNVNNIEKLKKDFKDAKKKKIEKHKVYIFLTESDFNKLDTITKELNISYTTFCEYAVVNVLKLYD